MTPKHFAAHHLLLRFEVGLVLGTWDIPDFQLFSCNVLPSTSARPSPSTMLSTELSTNVGLVPTGASDDNSTTQKCQSSLSIGNRSKLDTKGLPASSSSTRCPSCGRVPSPALVMPLFCFLVARAILLPPLMCCQCPSQAENAR